MAIFEYELVIILTANSRYKALQLYQQLNYIPFIRQFWKTAHLGNPFSKNAQNQILMQALDETLILKTKGSDLILFVVSNQQVYFSILIQSEESSCQSEFFYGHVVLPSCHIYILHRKSNEQIYFYYFVQMISFQEQEQKSAFTTQEQTPYSSHIFPSHSKLASSFVAVSPEQSAYLGESSQNSSPRKMTLNQIMSENLLLGEQAQPGRPDGKFVKRESEIWTADSSNHERFQARLLAPNTREVIRQQEQQVRQLRRWVSVLRKQCLVYEQTISKMDQRITNLQEENKTLTASLRIVELEKQNVEKTNRIKQLQWEQKLKNKEEASRQQIKQLKERVNHIMEMYGELESQANKSDFEWTIWKQKWIAEKRCYVNKIEQMEMIIKGINERPLNYSANSTRDKRTNESKRTWKDILKSEGHSRSKERTSRY